METSSLDLAWVDIVGLIVLGIMFVLGIFRGLWWQVIRLVGITGAVLLARALSPPLAPILQDTFPDLDERVSSGAVWLTIFILGLAAATLLGVVGRKLLKTMQLGLADRAGGALAGLLTGALIHIAFVATACQLAPEDWVSNNFGDTYSEKALEVAGTQWELIVGPEARRNLDELFKNAGDKVPNSSEIKNAFKEDLKDDLQKAADAVDAKVR